jgi:hypothetical protein
MRTAASRKVLREIGAEIVPSRLLLNKIDRVSEADCGFRRLRPGIPIERGQAFRSKAATCSDEGGRGVVAGMRSWVSFLGCVKIGALGGDLSHAISLEPPRAAGYRAAISCCLGPLPRWRSPELAAAYWGSPAATVASEPQGATAAESPGFVCALAGFCPRPHRWALHEALEAYPSGWPGRHGGVRARVVAAAWPWKRPGLPNTLAAVVAPAA